MELIDRYLHAVRRNLPQGAKGNGADDIVAELRDDLMSRVEDREEAKGRSLTKEETSALLKDVGHPLMVASRFRTHQYLIGPSVFPFYLSVLRIVLMIVVAIVFAVATSKALFGGGDLVGTWAHAMSDIWLSVLLNAGIVTLVFAVLERTNFPAEHLVKWVPDQLPDVLDKQKGQWESAFEVALGIAFLLWWTGLIHVPNYTMNRDFRFEPSPVFMQLWWPILALTSARLVHNLIQWLRPRWKVMRGLLSAATAVGGLAILALIYRAGQWVSVVSTGMKPEQAAQIQESLNLSLKIAIVVVGVIWTLQCMGEMYRLVRGRAKA